MNLLNPLLPTSAPTRTLITAISIHALIPIEITRGILTHPKKKGIKARKKKTVNKNSGTYAIRTVGTEYADAWLLLLIPKPRKSNPAVSPVKALPIGKPTKPSQDN